MLYIRDSRTDDLGTFAKAMAEALHIFPLVRKEDAERPGGVVYVGDVLGFKLELQGLHEESHVTGYSFDFDIIVPACHHAYYVCAACVHESVAIALVYAGYEVAQCFYDDSEGKHIPVIVRYSLGDVQPPTAYRKVIGTPAPPYDKVHRW